MNKHLILGFIFITISVYPQQIKNLDSLDAVIAKFTRTNDWKSLIESYSAKGDYYFLDKDYAESLPFFLKVDSISKAHNNINKTSIYVLLNRAEISRVTFTHEGVDEAGRLMYEALEHAKKIHSEEMEYLCYKYLADLEGLRDNLDISKQFLDLAFDYYKKHDDATKISQLYAIYINYYNTINQLDLSEKANQDRIDYLKTKGDTLQLANAIMTYGNFKLQKQKDCQGALKLYELAESLYTTVLKGEPYNNYRRLVQGMASCYATLNDYKKAYEYSELAYDLRNALNKQYNQDLSLKLETKYQTKEKEQEIALLKAKNELVEKQKSNQRNLLLAAILFTTMMGIFFFFLYRNRKKTATKLKELDNFKSRFFANISHEFRTPLTLISGLIDKSLAFENSDNLDKNELQIMQRNSNRLLNLVNQLLDVSKLESGNLKLNVSPGDLGLLIKAIGSSFQHIANQKSIQYTIDVAEMKNVWFDHDIIEKITTNLLQNAFKYTPKEGKVVCTASIADSRLLLRVENSGQHLSKEQLETIFNRFYQIDDNSEGIGIGLSLVKELVTLSHGTITVENTEVNTIAFKMSLPVLKTQFQPNEIAELNLKKPIENRDDIDLEGMARTIEVMDENLPIMLIVDDHQEILDLIDSIFKDSYQIVKAHDGEMGVSKAIELIPDIVISDVMMPTLNGFQLCETLKQDERTSHIPIILLTAKADEADSYIGLETGADEYLLKPFKTKALVSRVKNLIENRLKLRKRYSQEVILKPKDIAVTDYDKLFFEKVQNILETKLSEPTFTVEAFSEAIGMSRMQLHRKLKAFTGLSANEFIRSQRLQLAADLLQKGNPNISEVAYAVGFNDASYFAKCFKETFGCSPTTYASKF